MITTRTARTAALTLAAIAVLTFGGAVAAQAAPPESPAIPLNTGQEAPAPTPGGAHGSFSYEIVGDDLCYTVEVTGLSTPAVAAHIHVAPRNVPGPIVVHLVVPNETSFETSNCTLDVNPAILAAIDANPKDYYINVHTSMNMPGEVRGQLK